MINFILFIIMACYALYINHSWFKHCNKLNDRWAEHYNEVNKKWEELCNEVNKKWADFFYKIIEEEKND